MTSWESRRNWKQLFINHPTPSWKFQEKSINRIKLRVLNRETIFLWWQNVLSIQKFFLIKFHKLRSFHKQFPHKFYVVKWPLKFNSYCVDRQLWLEILWSHLYASHKVNRKKRSLSPLKSLFFSPSTCRILYIDYRLSFENAVLFSWYPLLRFHMPLELCVTLLLLSIDASSPKKKRKNILNRHLVFDEASQSLWRICIWVFLFFCLI